MAGTNHGQNVAVAMLIGLLAQPGSHVAVTLGDQRREQLGAILRELGEGGLEDIALLELLDVFFGDLVTRDQTGKEPGKQVDALEETEYEDHLLPDDGPITFEEGETPNAVPVVMQVQDGAVVQVWPEEIAEAEPRFCTSWGG